jgi:TIR domain/Tetratricopeptide repeat/NB-ARC domain
MGGDRKDFFVSHAGADRAWAEWVSWQLTEAGYAVELDVWDWPVGRNFALAMSDALDGCDRMVALLSAAYLDRSRYTTQEWAASQVHRPEGEGDRLVPVRVEDVPVAEVPGLLRPLVSCDLFGVDADEARRVLLAAVRGPQRPGGEPAFPGRGTPGGSREQGGAGPRLPGSLPLVWNLPARNLGFTGRDGLLVTVRERLLAGDKAVQAFQGMGGVGKTQLAMEYAYRFAGAYDVAWWVNSEQAGLIGEQVAALGAELDCAQAGAETEAMCAAVLRTLRGQDRWLLVFDNVADSGDVRPWLPGGSGHVLITSRERNWAEVAVPMEVQVLARAESVSVLQDRVAGLGEGDADRLAVQLGDLPLALAQAAGFMAETGLPADRYLDLLQTRAGQLLERGVPGSYPGSLAAATQLIADRLEDDDPVAAELASLCAFLAPEPIPDELFTAAAEVPGDLAARAADPLAWPQTWARVAQHALARVDQRGLLMHRLTQAILRDRLTSAQAAATRERAGVILVANDPGDPEDPGTWRKWARLMPHLLAIDMAATGNPALRKMACNACAYLLAHGDTATGHNLASDLRKDWRNLLGDDDVHTLAITHYLGSALLGMGRYAQAEHLDRDTLTRSRQVLGDDHPDTLIYASSLAIDLRELGEVQEARELQQDTLDRRKRVLGDDHPGTLASATSLAIDLRDLGELQAARDLAQDTLVCKRRVLGYDHPDTLLSASSLAITLYLLGEVQESRDLQQDTLDRRIRVLGKDHPHTLVSAASLADDLRALGEADDES